ncbi:hypothetical protein ORI89_02310 [Sphingobacterium sp. UT-1RO-CII-1]|uniref:hypothetical protein n=1 Tax=Sphingobacterium sp. UT-1RO-CII-1 TaxID=2995225 RepID=UPI00227B0C76|nr:hypothetical protein [Sphingobacterium sp. UT-1RO-CII-1]MCY4778469.1 hypothetical protein [Sphingobacterium sp. UT-1RO-CII-1]
MKSSLFLFLCLFLFVAQAQDSKSLVKSKDLILTYSKLFDKAQSKGSIDTVITVKPQDGTRLLRSPSNLFVYGGAIEIPNHNPHLPYQPLPVLKLSGKRNAPMAGTAPLDSLEKKKTIKDEQIAPEVLRIQVFPAK